MAQTPPPPSRGDEDAWCAAVVQRVGAGGSGALEELYDRYARPAYSLTRRVTGEQFFAQEVVQEVFLAVRRQPERFQPARGGFASWLLAAVHHKSVNFVRREEAQRRREIAALRSVGDEEAAPPPERPDMTEERLRGEQVRLALRTLPHAQREALALAYYAGYPQREIASLTGTRPAP